MRICKDCKWWAYEEIDQSHICCNSESHKCAEWTEEDYFCDKWEKKDDNLHKRKNKRTGKEEYMKQFANAEKKLTEQGYTVINPAKVNAQMPEDTSYDGYMKMSKAMLEQADCIFLMDGWQLSNGATLEMQWALNKGMMFIFEDTSYVRDTFLLANKAQMDNMYAYSIGGK